MALNDEKPNDPNEAIQRALNDAKRQELEEQFGMMHSVTNPDLDPEVEGDFLNYILEWERANAVAQQTTVWEFIGKPEYEHVEGLSNDAMSSEIDRIFTLMADNQMYLDTPGDVMIKQLYDFVFQKFLQEECSDMRIEGMNHRFIWEEYFPDRYPLDDLEMPPSVNE